jgi:GntR family transcriptional regulator, transcriptional repressor for pyruvate dehydrogenase complex
MGVTDQAITRIRQLIASGELQPGRKLPPEHELSTQLGVSRGSMREAVRALVSARVLDVRWGDGTYVTSLEPHLLLEGFGLAVELLQGDSLLEVHEVRRLLEPVATGLAATRITDDDLAELGGHLEAMRAALGDIEKLTAHDAAFHDCVSKATGNETLRSVLGGLSHRTVRFRLWRGATEAEAAKLTVAQHEEIYAALAVRDQPLAEAAALLHVTTSERWLRRALGGAVQESSG